MTTLELLYLLLPVLKVSELTSNLSDPAALKGLLQIDRRKNPIPFSFQTVDVDSVSSALRTGLIFPLISKFSIEVW